MNYIHILQTWLHGYWFGAHSMEIDGTYSDRSTKKVGQENVLQVGLKFDSFGPFKVGYHLWSDEKDTKIRLSVIKTMILMYFIFKCSVTIG